ncbi:hypothetical protein C8R45DRAFT_1173523 [Mycena sanguinolenta]|nr:hypothetical protein C8R45DRAFT_1173523 [Mycena sanguinolenta]
MLSCFSGLAGRLPRLARPAPGIPSESVRFLEWHTFIAISPPPFSTECRGIASKISLHVEAKRHALYTSHDSRPGYCAADVENILIHFRVGRWPSPTLARSIGAGFRQHDLACAAGDAFLVFSISATDSRRAALAIPSAVRAVGIPHNLKILNVAHVRMAEAELLVVLSVLDELQIADKRSVDSKGADMVLVTDALLRAITYAAPDITSTTLLISQLRVLRCASRFQFTHNLLLEFVSSRLELAPNSSPFLLKIQLLTEADRRLDAKVHGRLEALWSRRRRFGYCFGSAERVVREIFAE